MLKIIGYQIMLENYSHIIWDWNGTLFNDVELCADVFNNLLQKYKLSPITIKKYKEIFTFPVQKYYESAGLDFKIYSFEKLGREWMDEYESRKSTCSLFGSTIEVLDHIKNKNIPQSILSAYRQDTLNHIVNLMGIKDYFTYIFGLHHIYATGKTELGLEMAAQIGTNKKLLFIGDTEHDFEVAEAMGAECILISDGHQSKDNLLKTRAVVLDSMSELLKL